MRDFYDDLGVMSACEDGIDQNVSAAASESDETDDDRFSPPPLVTLLKCTVR